LLSGVGAPKSSGRACAPGESRRSDRGTLEAKQTTRKRITFSWWWLIWVAAGLCISLFGAGLGVMTSAGASTSRLSGLLLSRFGGRSHVSILLVGVDKSQGRGLADTLMVCVVQPKTGEVGVLSIPRDSRVELPGVGIRRINAAHSIGGMPLTIETVELLLGLPTDYYVQMNVAGMVELVDAIGGVDIEVEKRMYYRDRSQDLLIDLQPGLQRLDGEQAMGYVRFRHDATGDLGRVARQRTFLRAVAGRLLAPEMVSRIPRLIDAFLDNVDTNMSPKELVALKKVLEDSGVEGIRMDTLPGEPKMVHGQSMIELDAEQVQSTVNRVLWGYGVSVSVLNGTDVPGLAGEIAAKLERRGCHIVAVGNTEGPADTTRIVDHRNQTARAQRVFGWLGRGTISVAPDAAAEADVTVILGADMVEGRP